MTVHGPEGFDPRRKEYPYILTPYESQRAYTTATHTLIRANSANIHPDGEPWKKCCNTDPACDYLASAGCACARGALSVFTKDNIQDYSMPFVCMHRKTVDGFFRVCAGWHALWNKMKVPE